MKVLIVDDSKLARLSLIKTVKKIEPHIDVFQAENGAIALELFKQEGPRIVFLDLTMPVMDGYEALEKILEIDPDTQVVIVTADIQPEAQKRVLNGGAKYICPKPINDEKMLDIFQNYLTI